MELPWFNGRTSGFVGALGAGGTRPSLGQAGTLSRKSLRWGDSSDFYKSDGLLGEGGFGVVWKAEQLEPIQRTVALKLIKPGMDTREVLARFAAERQALARMEHPNIARVLDAGATDVGRPYFVMELVAGVPITEFCDDHQLSIRDRIALVTWVCEAIGHAHSKGVIHRDIKPSNILVDGSTLVHRLVMREARALILSSDGMESP